MSGLQCACDHKVSPTMFRSASQSVYILDISKNIFSMCLSEAKECLSDT